MSSEFEDVGGPVTMPGAGAVLARLVGDSAGGFGQDVWGRRPLLTPAASDFADLFSAAAVDELVSRRGLRTPFLRMAKEGRTLADDAFTASAGVGATIADQLDDTAVWRNFADGATIVLQALHRTWAPISDFVAELATETGHPVQANAYVTPAANRGFDDHYDVHDVFVLQIEGTKRWVIHSPVHPAPLRDQPWTDRRPAVEQEAQADPVIDAVLRPGDCLYLPRGWLHAAEAQGEVSIHLTLGVHVWTRYAVVEQLMHDALSRLRQDPMMRESLPLGVADPQDVVEQVRKQLVAVLDEADPAPAFQRTRRGQQRPAPLGPLAQWSAVNELSEDSIVQLRDGLVPRLEGGRLHTRAGWLDLTAKERAAIPPLLHGQPRTAGQLGLEFARRLLHAGVAVPARR